MGRRGKASGPVLGAKGAGVAAKQGAGTGRKGRHQATPGGTSPYILDRLLVPRVVAWGKTHSLADPDAVMAGLRQVYKEYQRRPQAAFRQMVQKAIQAARANDHPAAEETETPLGSPSVSSASGRSNGGGDTAVDTGTNGGEPAEPGAASSSSASSSSSSDGGSGSSSGDEEEETSPQEAAARQGMNDMLTSMYARTPAAAGGAGPEGTAGPGPGSIAHTTVNGRRRDASPPRAAFAAPEVVAAAAARALAQSAGKRTAAKSTDPASNGDQTSGPAPGAKDASKAGNAEPIADAATTTPAPSSKPNSRSAAEAGLPDGPVHRASTIKRARRGGSAVAGGGAGALGGPSRGGGRSGGWGGGSAVVSARPVTYADLGGIEDVLSSIRELIEYPLKHPEVYSWLGVEPPRGVLLHGPPGCGKTALANAIANECGVPFLRVSAPEIVSGMSGESEAKLRSLFQEAADLAPCIVFIDEIDAIAPKRETAQREMERRIVAQMLTCMDDLSAPSGPAPTAPPTDGPPAAADGAVDPSQSARAPQRAHVVVIGATNRPDALDPALRRAGRFDREISLGIPTEAARAKILQVIARGLRLEGNFDFLRIAKRTPGFVGADLMALVKEAAALAVNRIFKHLEAQGTVGEAAVLLSGPQDPAPQVGVGIEGPAGPASVNGLVGTSTAGDGGAAGSADAAAPSVGGDAVAGATQPQPLGRVVAGLGGASIAHAVRAAVPSASAAGPAAGQRFGAGALGPAELAGLAISMADFECAVSKVQPSVRREGFTTTPDVTWEDVGSLDEVRDELSFAITHPIMNPESFTALGMPTATGVLLYGPPGCGKTLVAKAVANESGANFISIKGPELLNKYVGESERAVRQLFARARAAQPCVLFFDELDALAPRRGTDTNQAAERVVNQLLTEMDGVEGRMGVYVVAATNRPDMIDPALLRPGRLDKVLYVPLPPPDGRASILRALSRGTPLGPDVDMEDLAAGDRCSGFSGADMAALVREASVLALKESMRAGPRAAVARGAAGTGPAAPVPRILVYNRHFEAALGRVVPSVSRRDARMYDALRKSLRGNLRSTRLEPAAVPDDAAVLESVPVAADAEGGPHESALLPGAALPTAGSAGDGHTQGGDEPMLQVA